MFLLNSCLGLFTAAPSRGLPFLRTYGVNLPSSLTTSLPLVLGYSPHPPVSVCGTGTCLLDSSFSRQCDIGSFGTNTSLRITPQTRPPYLTNGCSLQLVQTLPAVCLPSLLCPCLSQTMKGSTGISTCSPSTTPLGLALGPD